MTKNKIKKAVILSALVLPGLITIPAFAQEVNPKNSIKTNKSIDLKSKDIATDKLNKNISNKESSNKKPEKIEDIQQAIESQNLQDFNKSIKEIGIKDDFSENQFQTIISAYTKARSGDIQGAQIVLRNGGIMPVVNKFILRPRIELTDSQKNALREAEILVRQGKIDEARDVVVSVGLPSPEPEKPIENQAENEVKDTIKTAKLLRSEGKNREAVQVLENAGVSEKTFRNLEREINADSQRERNNFLGVIKNFFKFNKN